MNKNLDLDLRVKPKTCRDCPCKAVVKNRPEFESWLCYVALGILYHFFEIQISYLNMEIMILLVSQGLHEY